MNVYKPVFTDENAKARQRLWKIIEKHVHELKAAYDEYLDADPDKSERRELELDQYLLRECEDKKLIYSAARKAIREAYPKAQKAFRAIDIPVASHLPEQSVRQRTIRQKFASNPEKDVLVGGNHILF